MFAFTTKLTPYHTRHVIAWQCATFTWRLADNGLRWRRRFRSPLSLHCATHLGRARNRLYKGSRHDTTHKIMH